MGKTAIVSSKTLAKYGRLAAEVASQVKRSGANSK